MKIKVTENSYKVIYPCQWLYKVIGSDQEQIQQAIAQVVQDASCSVTPSNSSQTGKYHSYNLEITVHSEDERNRIYQDLKDHPSIKIVL